MDGIDVIDRFSNPTLHSLLDIFWCISKILVEQFRNLSAYKFGWISTSEANFVSLRRNDPVFLSYMCSVFRRYGHSELKAKIAARG